MSCCSCCDESDDCCTTKRPAAVSGFTLWARFHEKEHITEGMHRSAHLDMPFCVDSVRNVLLLSFLQFVLLLAGGTRYGHGADATDRAAPSNCFLGISTGPPSKVALVLSSFSTHVSPQQNLFVLLTTRAAEHESYFSHLVGRIVFVSIQYADADLPLINMKRFQIFLEILLHMGGLNEDGSEGLPQCSNVMFLDTYDVFFQGNPFDSPRYSGSLTFTTESKSVGEDIWNAQWYTTVTALKS